MKIMSFSDFKVRNIAKVVCFTLGVSTLAACNIAEIESVEKPEDTTPPVLTLTGDAEVTIPSFESGLPYVEVGATAVDDVDGPVSVTPSGHLDVDTTTLGDYIVTFNATDSSGNEAEPVTRKVTVIQAIDVDAPVITLEGDAEISFTLGESSYSELGATAKDAFDGFATGNANVDVVIGGDTVDNDAEGLYTITYTASDVAGNTATLERTVEIIGDPEAPKITLYGEKDMTLLVNRPYREFGFTAFDEDDNLEDDVKIDVSADVTTTGTVDVTTPGTYTVTYSVTDDQGKSDTKVRTVNVVALEDARPFKFTVKTAVADETFTLTTVATDDFYIDWGEGDAEVHVLASTEIANTFDAPGEYTVSIRTNYTGGSYDKFITPTDILKVSSVIQWGDIRWYNFQNSFQNSGTFSAWPTDVPDIERTKDPLAPAVGIYRNAFNGSQFNQPVNLWDMEGQTNILSMFRNAPNFNQPLDKWDTSSLTNARYTFQNATSFDQNLGSWNMSKLTSANGSSQATFNGTGFSVANWDATLIGWAAQTYDSSASGSTRIQASGVQHSSAATDAIDTLLGLGWSINSTLVEAP